MNCRVRAEEIIYQNSLSDSNDEARMLEAITTSEIPLEEVIECTSWGLSTDEATRQGQVANILADEIQSFRESENPKAAISRFFNSLAEQAADNAHCREMIGI